ncbi:transporter [Candidatus Dependentiae bacterium]|nr:transporter [Candidatus Dependentiae bacterium]
MTKKILLSSLIIIAVLLFSKDGQTRQFESIFGIDNNFLQIQDVDIEQGFCLYKDYANLNYDFGIMPVRIGWGVMHNMEIGVKIPYIFVENNDNGFGDISIYQKFKFIEEAGKTPVLSGGLELNFPTGSVSGIKQYDNKKLDIKLFASAGKDFPNFRLFGSTGINFLNAGDNTAIEYDAGINFSISKKLKVAAELTGIRVSESADFGFKTQSYFSPGLIFDSEKNLVLKLAVPIGLSSKSGDCGINFSLTHSF